MDKIKTLIGAFHPRLREGYVPFRDPYSRGGQYYDPNDKRERSLIGGLVSSVFGDNTTSSTNTTTELNTSLTNIMSSTVQSCAAQATMTQTVDQSGSYNIMDNVTQSQALHFTLDCKQGGKVSDKVSDALTAAIKSKADATGQVFSGTSTNSDNTSTISNSVKQVINDSSMQTMSDSLNAAQGVDQSGNHNIMVNITQSQTMDMIAKQSADLISQIGVVNEMNASADTGASATTENPFDFLGDFAYLIIVFVIIGAFFFYKIFIDTGSAAPAQPAYRPPPPPAYRPPPPPPQYAPQYAPYPPPQYAPYPPQAPAQTPAQAPPQAPPMGTPAPLMTEPTAPVATVA